MRAITIPIGLVLRAHVQRLLTQDSPLGVHVAAERKDDSFEELMEWLGARLRR